MTTGAALGASRGWVLRPHGWLGLVEGHWSTGAALTAVQAESLVRQVREEALGQWLTDPALWGRDIEDERYLLLLSKHVGSRER